MAQKIRKTAPKKTKNSITTGVVHIQSTFNNTIVTITNLTGDTIAWASAGSTGFKGARKGTPFAAQTAAEKASLDALNCGLKSVEILVKVKVLAVKQQFVQFKLPGLKSIQLKI